MSKTLIFLCVIIFSLLEGLFLLAAPLEVALKAFLLIPANVTFFWLILKLYTKPSKSQDENRQATNTSLFIAHETLPYLRHGLDENTAQNTAEIIKKISQLPAVAITDKEKILAFLGVGCERHRPGDPIVTSATKEVLKTGKYKVIETSEGFNCPVKDCSCPLGAAIIVPLKVKGKVIGTLKLYDTRPGPLPDQSVRLALGIGQLLSMQTELAELDRQSQLLTKARLDALHAQINPHFFFNTINTIVLYSRTNPEKARQLLIHLADFFRQTLRRRGHYITLGEELECIHTYLTLEKARFEDSLKIVQDIDDCLLDTKIPFLSLQPIVENAVKHGITPKVGGGTLKISASMVEDTLVMMVSDDGVGIPEEKIHLVLQPGYGSGNGVGLSNVHERLISLYGPSYGLRICSSSDQGTTVQLRIPIKASISDENSPNTSNVYINEITLQSQ
ncbi:histidine kinase [Desulfitibacter alkalitolerans]|uniref:histidine kinase n=1 Tax=Desulfitibacter alkalitolerans TaxID=264641 RepID=UPI000687753B|nr:histidine kinase [Desulfitibacter alkalitolerans]